MRYWLTFVMLLGSVCKLFADDIDFVSSVRPLLEKHCYSCHGEKKQKASINFSEISKTEDAMEQYALWRKVKFQILDGEMPPDEPLSEKEEKRLLGWIDKTFDTSKPDPGPPPARQLTRGEYDKTVRDLLQINFSPANAAGIPREQVVGGYHNRAGGLVLEPLLMEKYFSAADMALEYLFENNGGRHPREQLLQGQPKEGVTQQEAVRIVMADFLKCALRRPVTNSEVERYSKVGDLALQAGDDFQIAIRKAMKAPLVSPHFLIRMEKQPSGKPGTIARVRDHELAVRLSFFIWGTMPDKELFQMADDGKLSDPEVLKSQTLRMLKDRRAEALNRNVLEHWLEIPHLSKSLPSQNYFPTYTRSLRDSMGREAREFCNHLRAEDRSILELLDSDYTFVNAELAKHYGLKNGPNGKQFEKVALRPEDHRGGVLGMAAILTMTSHRDRTKPTARGKWILDVLLGTPPPPPPANVGDFAEPEKGQPEPRNFREKLERHAQDPNCVTCHKKIDPLGFALENYNAIGSWREDMGGEAIDNLGHLPGVGEIRGVQGLRKVLEGKQEQIVRNIASQMLTYALGRDLSFYDEPALDEIVLTVEANDYRFSALVLGVVNSYPFQHRKAE